MSARNQSAYDLGVTFLNPSGKKMTSGKVFFPWSTKPPRHCRQTCCVLSCRLVQRLSYLVMRHARPNGWSFGWIALATIVAQIQREKKSDINLLRANFRGVQNAHPKPGNENYQASIQIPPTHITSGLLMMHFLKEQHGALMTRSHHKQPVRHRARMYTAKGSKGSVPEFTAHASVVLPERYASSDS